MTKELNVNEVVERARRAQESRLAVIKGLAEAQQNVTKVRADAAEQIAKIEQETSALIAAAEREHVSEFQGAQRAGWSADELKSLGFTEPDKTARMRKRTARKSVQSGGRGPVKRASDSTQSESIDEPAV